MGLDMYLSESKYIGHYEYMISEDHIGGSGAEYELFTTVRNAAGLVNAPAEPNSSIEMKMTVAYWRKAHAIHGWFVKNVQGGVDECQESEVTRENLEKLVADCQEILQDHSKAEELLPATDGFFFGVDRDNPYNEWYFKDLQETVEKLVPIVARTLEVKQLGTSEYDPCYFIYQASW